jgi:hypothetical protein
VSKITLASKGHHIAALAYVRRKAQILKMPKKNREFPGIASNHCGFTKSARGDSKGIKLNMKYYNTVAIHVNMLLQDMAADRYCAILINLTKIR